MPWFKVDDRLHAHPKWLAASPHARALWTTAGSWCGAMSTDGVVPKHVLGTLGGRPRDAAELVAVGLWLEHPDGWAFHDWLDMQPSAAQVEADRAAARERQRRSREKAASRRDIGVSHSSPTRPDPTRPVDTSPLVVSPPLPEAPQTPDTKLSPEQVAANLEAIESLRNPPRLRAVGEP